MPKRESIEVVVGHPIACPQVDSPTQAQIDEYHLRYITALKQLYELHRRRGAGCAVSWGARPPPRPSRCNPSLN